MKRFLEWMGRDGIVVFLIFDLFGGGITDNIWTGAVAGVLASVVGYWIVLGMERHDEKLLEPYQRNYDKILGDYRKLRAFAWEVVNRRVPKDFEGPQTIALGEKEIADIREALNSNYC